MVPRDLPKRLGAALRWICQRCRIWVRFRQRHQCRPRCRSTSVPRVPRLHCFSLEGRLRLAEPLAPWHAWDVSRRVLRPRLRPRDRRQAQRREVPSEFLLRRHRHSRPMRSEDSPLEAARTRSSPLRPVWCGPRHSIASCRGPSHPWQSPKGRWCPSRAPPPRRRRRRRMPQARRPRRRSPWRDASSD